MMKVRASMLLAAILLIGAIAPVSALAATGGTAAAASRPKVQVINVNADDIGPATYSGGRRLLKLDKAPTVVRSGIISTIETNAVAFGKRAGWYVAERKVSRQSWLGITQYTLKVTGEYHSTGSSIDEYGEPDYEVSTTITWKSKSERAMWSRKSKTSGVAKASAIFVGEIPTPWGGIQLQQVSQSVTGDATP